ncbi:MAG: transporter substrate-binding domain-containing protein [Bacteroidales bacterium]|nr:transporter substrate-binding domain-containing protein [Bacteroidales bacterium]
MKNLVILASIFVLSVFACKNDKNLETNKIPHIDLNEIRQRGSLVVVTDYNSTNYFIYRGQPMGFQYDLLKELEKYLDIKMDIRVNNDLGDNFDCLVEGSCDLIALNLTITKERKKIVSFTEPHSQTRQVLVQRKPENWTKMSKKERDLSVIRNQLMLANEDIEIYVQKNSSHAARLKNLSDEIGDSIRVIEVDEDAEILVGKVASGEIDYTVCDENVAKVNQTYYPNIDIQTSVSFPQYLAWAVRPDSKELLEEINKWMSEFKNSKKYAIIYNKYFKNTKSADIVNSDYYALNSGRISIYDETVKQYSEQIGWDWRLVSSVIYQESRFNPTARSWAGAYGLMQLMPATAKRFGVDSSSSPESNIRAGIRFLKWLDDRFKDEVPNEEERIKFVLASYNVGMGHIMDAMALANEHGKNTKKWEDNVEFYLIKKTDPKYFTDPVVKHGYCRGNIPAAYTREILERYEHYKNIVPS